MSAVRVAGTNTYEDLVDAMIGIDLPALPTDRRDATVGFASRRLQTMASPIRVAVQLSSIALALPVRVVGADSVARWLAKTGLPLASDLPRAMRYLIVSYVWETWPDTQPDGAACDTVNNGDNLNNGDTVNNGVEPSNAAARGAE